MEEMGRGVELEAINFLRIFQEPTTFYLMVIEME
jgi:hypothetical protein